MAIAKPAFLLAGLVIQSLLVVCIADELKKPTSKPGGGSPAPSLKLNNVFGVDIAAHTRDLVQAVPSTVVLLIANHILKTIIKDKLNMRKIPHALVGMFVVFGGLVSLSDDHASKVVTFMKPGVDLLTSFLQAFFIPALVVSPLSLSSMTRKDSVKFFSAIGLGMPFVYLITGKTVEFLQRYFGAKRAEPQSSAPVASAKFQPPFSDSLEKLFTTLAVVAGGIALAYPKFTQPFYSIATIYAYVFAARLPRLLGPTISRYWHPLLTSFTWSSAILAIFGAFRGQSLVEVLHEYFVPGGVPLSAAGNYVLFWLEPSIITFAFGLFARKQLLFANFVPIIGGSLTATLFGIALMATMGRLLAPSRAVKLALLPRATAALAMVQAASIGANPPLTAVNCCAVGIMGANFGLAILDAIGVKDPIARGVATGGSGFALSAASLTTMDPAAFPFGALGMSLTSATATTLYCIPQFTAAVLRLAGETP